MRCFNRRSVDRDLASRASTAEANVLSSSRRATASVCVGARRARRRSSLEGPALTDLPRIYADFNNVDEDGRLRLNVRGALDDIARVPEPLQTGDRAARPESTSDGARPGRRPRRHRMALRRERSTARLSARRTGTG
jgi:hypothetical protein